jgi:hypothetical protein
MPDQPDQPKKARRVLSPKLRRRLKRGLIGAFAAAPVLVLGLWLLVHKVEWMGPLLANSLRAVIGSDNVARLEDFVYAVEDRYNRWRRKDEKPKAYWEVPPAEPSAAPPKVASAGGVPALPPFRPKSVGPMHKSWSAPGDGDWVPIRDARRPNEEPYLYKTLLHPDPNRSWSEVFVVAVDLRRVSVHAVVGRNEPKSLEKESQNYERIARIRDEHHDQVLGAFNGSFMTEHGYYGMKVDGVTLVKPREKPCTIAVYKDGSMRIATWKAIANTEPEMAWFRQAPSCMYENGELHPGLQAGGTAHWGATLDGETVIRRSAAGLDKARQVLYVGITNHTTARAIAIAMNHAGAADVTQLDVNWSYPKFVLFDPGPDGKRIAVALAKGFEFSEDEYIRKRSIRDFFYLMPKNPDASRN